MLALCGLIILLSTMLIKKQHQWTQSLDFKLQGCVPSPLSSYAGFGGMFGTGFGGLGANPF